MRYVLSSVMFCLIGVLGVFPQNGVSIPPKEPSLSGFLDDTSFRLSAMAIDSVLDTMHTVDSTMNLLSLSIEEIDLSVESAQGITLAAEKLKVRAGAIMEAVERLYSQISPEIAVRKERIHKVLYSLSSATNSVDSSESLVAVNDDAYLADLSFFNAGSFRRQLRIDQVFFLKLSKKINQIEMELSSIIDAASDAQGKHQNKDTVIMDLIRGVHSSLGDVRLVTEFGYEVLDVDLIASEDGRAAARAAQLHQKIQPQIFKAVNILGVAKETFQNGLTLISNMSYDIAEAMDHIQNLLPQLHRFKSNDVACSHLVLDGEESLEGGDENIF